MGVLSDVVVASESEASSILHVAPRTRPWPWADMKGIEPVKLGRLEAVFRGGPYDDRFVAACALLASTEDHSVLVLRIPGGLTDHLARVEAAAATSLAKQWSEADEFARWQLKDVERALVELVRLARIARTTERDLLLWMSL